MNTARIKKTGWFLDSQRHSLARRGLSSRKVHRNSKLRSEYRKHPWMFKGYLARRTMTREQLLRDLREADRLNNYDKRVEILEQLAYLPVEREEEQDDGRMYAARKKEHSRELPADQVKIGMQHELEHAATVRWIEKEKPSVREAARRIAIDHIKEDQRYYPHIVAMEKKYGEGRK